MDTSEEVINTILEAGLQAEMGLINSMVETLAGQAVKKKLSPVEIFKLAGTSLLACREEGEIRPDDLIAPLAAAITALTIHSLATQPKPE